MRTQIPIRVPEQRDFTDPLLRFLMVTPTGEIKTIYYERNVATPLLQCAWIVSGDRRVGLAHVEPSFWAKSAGYSDLLALLQAEDREEDFDAILQWYEIARMNPMIDPLPAEYLPDEVLRRRALKTQRVAPQLPPPVRKRRAQADNTEEPAQDKPKAKGGK